MHKSFVYVSIMVFIFAWGCSKEQNQPADAKSSASRPASTAMSGPKLPKGPRKYQPMPESLLSPSGQSSPTAFSEWTLVQEELAKGSLDEAIRAYDRIKAGFPAEQRLCSITALQLSDALIYMTPPDLVRAGRLLKTLEEGMDSWGGDKRLRGDYDRQCLLVDLADARKALASGDAEFTKWLSSIIGRVKKLNESAAIGRDLLRMVDYILGPTGPKDAVIVDRMEAMLAGLQTGCAWRWADLLRALQERRVQLLSDAKRPVEALFEARVLLALSSQDAKAWIASFDRIPVLMRAAGLDDNNIARFVAYQQHGMVGPDGRKGAGGDITDPIAEVKRDAAKPWGAVGASDKQPAPATAQAPMCENAIREGICLLLAGRGKDAKECLRKVYQPATEVSSLQVELVLKYLAMAQAYCDGHALGCDRCAADVVAAMGKAESYASKLWRYEAIQFLKQREVLVARLIDERRMEAALGLCRAMTESDCTPDRLDAVINHAWRACELKGKTVKVETAIPWFMDFGKTLTNPLARIRHVRIAAAKYKEAGDEASILPAIEGLKDIWEQAANDSDLVLLRSSSLVRLGRSSEALPELKQLVQRSDLTPECSWRGQLLLGVAYVQEGQLAESRAVLHRLLEENPNAEYRNKVITVLSNIPM